VPYLFISGSDVWISYGLIQELSTSIDLKFKLPEELKIALNNSLDFDLNQTTTYLALEIELKNEMTSTEFYPWWDFVLEENVAQELRSGSNMDITNYIPQEDGRIVQLNSKWVALPNLNQYVFSIDYDENIITEGSAFSIDNPPFDPDQAKYEVSKIKLKVMHDFYFDQIGFLGEQINTTQVHTYLMFDKESNINFMPDSPSDWGFAPPLGMYDQYLIGEYEIGNSVIYSVVSDPLVTEVTNGKTIIHAQEVEINGNVTVSPVPSNDELIVEALEMIHLVPGAHINSQFPDKVQFSIKKDFLIPPQYSSA
jgi:hypothetical protein